MDKRLRPLDPGAEAQARADLYRRIVSGDLTIGESVRLMRKLSRLTQPEFAKHRGISLDSLRAIENGFGNPTTETLNKVVSIFGFQVGLVRRRSPSAGAGRASKDTLG